MDQMEPLRMTDEEIEALGSGEKSLSGEWDKSHFLERTEKLEKMWQCGYRLLQLGTNPSS